MSEAKHVNVNPEVTPAVIEPKALPSAEAPRPSPAEAAAARARVCLREIHAVLARHDCRIKPVLNIEAVGNDAARALVSTRWGVYPNESQVEDHDHA